jgi:hypothetical protein
MTCKSDQVGDSTWENLQNHIQGVRISINGVNLDVVFLNMLSVGNDIIYLEYINHLLLILLPTSDTTK